MFCNPVTKDQFVILKVCGRLETNDNRYFVPAPPQGNPTESLMGFQASSADRNCLRTSQNFVFQPSSVTFTTFIVDHTFS